jgi:hypothetical protein
MKIEMPEDEERDPAEFPSMEDWIKYIEDNKKKYLEAIKQLDEAAEKYDGEPSPEEYDTQEEYQKAYDEYTKTKKSR